MAEKINTIPKPNSAIMSDPRMKKYFDKETIFINDQELALTADGIEVFENTVGKHVNILRSAEGISLPSGKSMLIFQVKLFFHPHSPNDYLKLGKLIFHIHRFPFLAIKHPNITAASSMPDDKVTACYVKSINVQTVSGVPYGILAILQLGYFNYAPYMSNFTFSEGLTKESENILKKLTSEYQNDPVSFRNKLYPETLSGLLCEAMDPNGSPPWENRPKMFAMLYEGESQGSLSYPPDAFIDPSAFIASEPTENVTIEYAQYKIPRYGPQVHHPEISLEDLVSMRGKIGFDFNKIPARKQYINKKVAKDFSRIGNEFVNKFGPYMIITSCFRTKADQERLKQSRPELANKPGTSWHEAGCAMDIKMGYAIYMHTANSKLDATKNANTPLFKQHCKAIAKKTWGVKALSKLKGKQAYESEFVIKPTSVVVNKGIVKKMTIEKRGQGLTPNQWLWLVRETGAACGSRIYGAPEAWHFQITKSSKGKLDKVKEIQRAGTFRPSSEQVKNLQDSADKGLQEIIHQWLTDAGLNTPNVGRYDYLTDKIFLGILGLKSATNKEIILDNSLKGAFDPKNMDSNEINNLIGARINEANAYIAQKWLEINAGDRTWKPFELPGGKWAFKRMRGFSSLARDSEFKTNNGVTCTGMSVQMDCGIAVIPMEKFEHPTVQYTGGRKITGVIQFVVSGGAGTEFANECQAAFKTQQEIFRNIRPMVAEPVMTVQAMLFKYFKFDKCRITNYSDSKLEGTPFSKQITLYVEGYDPDESGSLKGGFEFLVGDVSIIRAVLSKMAKYFIVSLTTNPDPKKAVFLTHKLKPEESTPMMIKAIDHFREFVEHYIRFVGGFTEWSIFKPSSIVEDFAIEDHPYKYEIVEGGTVNAPGNMKAFYAKQASTVKKTQSDPDDVVKRLQEVWDTYEVFANMKFLVKGKDTKIEFDNNPDKESVATQTWNNYIQSFYRKDIFPIIYAIPEFAEILKMYNKIRLGAGTPAYHDIALPKNPISGMERDTNPSVFFADPDKITRVEEQRQRAKLGILALRNGWEAMSKKVSKDVSFIDGGLVVIPAKQDK